MLKKSLYNKIFGNILESDLDEIKQEYTTKWKIKYETDLDEVLSKFSTEEILEKLNIKDIEKFLRKKKLENINC